MRILPILFVMLQSAKHKQEVLAPELVALVPDQAVAELAEVQAHQVADPVLVNNSHKTCSHHHSCSTPHSS